MSVERYYAICHPLKSRESRQTLGHAYRIIAAVWLASLLFMSPIAYLSKLQPIRQTGKSHTLQHESDNDKAGKPSLHLSNAKLIHKSRHTASDKAYYVLKELSQRVDFKVIYVQ